MNAYIWLKEEEKRKKLCVCVCVCVCEREWVRERDIIKNVFNKTRIVCTLFFIICSNWLSTPLYLINSMSKNLSGQIKQMGNIGTWKKNHYKNIHQIYVILQGLLKINFLFSSSPSSNLFQGILIVYLPL